MLSYAESHTKGLDHAATLAILGEVLRRIGIGESDTSKLRAAEMKLKDALDYGNKWFTPRRDSKISEYVYPAGYGEWTKLKARLDRLLFSLSIDLLAGEYGRGYADYVAMRTHFDKERWWLAYPLAEKLAEENPDTALGEAGRYYDCRMLLINNQAEEYRDKSAREGVEATIEFIESKPYGLYRGEAMMELGKYFLEYKRDVRNAAVWYDKALAWFREVRERDDAVDLYALSGKLAAVAAVKGPLERLDEWRMTIRREIDPKEVVNRKTAPWLVSANEKECLFTCGFLKFVNGDYDGAKRYFERVKDVDTNVARLVGQKWPNVYWRLISACNVKRMVFPGKDKKSLKGDNKLRCAYAELNYICEKFKKSKKLFQEMLDDPKSSKTERALALLGVIQCMDHTMKSENARNAKKKMFALYGKVLKLAGKKQVAATAYFNLGCLWMTVGWKHRCEKAIACFKKYIKLRPNGVFAKEAKFRLVQACLIKGDYAKARALYKKFEFKRKYPKSGFTRALARMLAKK